MINSVRLLVLSFFASSLLAAGYAFGLPDFGTTARDIMLKGYRVSATGLRPEYPRGYACSPLTSLYASWLDVDGTRRDDIHTGVDGGRLGEAILSPAPGVVRAAWEANWGWGQEGSLIIRHAREDLNIDSGPAYYYSVFDHVKYSEIRKFRLGQRVKRGQTLGTVYRPGGKHFFLPEVHWEVWEVDNDDTLKWKTNKFGAPDWRSKSARLIDPLYLMALQVPLRDEKFVRIQPFEAGRDFSEFRGFTYILPCAVK
jgi:murein DD-endopeptidase MepM/ murein hydrolase activator NlpD